MLPIDGDFFDGDESDRPIICLASTRGAIALILKLVQQNSLF